jgi:hypothetical protein
MVFKTVGDGCDRCYRFSIHGDVCFVSLSTELVCVQENYQYRSKHLTVAGPHCLLQYAGSFMREELTNEYVGNR